MAKVMSNRNLSPAKLKALEYISSIARAVTQDLDIQLTIEVLTIDSDDGVMITKEPTGWQKATILWYAGKPGEDDHAGA